MPSSNSSLASSRGPACRAGSAWGGQRGRDRQAVARDRDAVWADDRRYRLARVARDEDRDEDRARLPLREPDGS
jgi:hypothetical protein